MFVRDDDLVCRASGIGVVASVVVAFDKNFDYT